MKEAILIFIAFVLAVGVTRIHVDLTRIASGIETEGHDRADGHGAKHESPMPKADAQGISQ